jgi:hypothetical protein
MDIASQESEMIEGLELYLILCHPSLMPFLASWIATNSEMECEIQGVEGKWMTGFQSIACLTILQEEVSTMTDNEPNKEEWRQIFDGWLMGLFIWCSLLTYFSMG